MVNKKDTLWYQYEKYCIEFHKTNIHKTAIHWDDVDIETLLDMDIFYSKNINKHNKNIMDQGFDGIAYNEIDGEKVYYGIQCKYRERKKISAGSISSFIIHGMMLHSVNNKSKSYLYYNYKLSNSAYFLFNKINEKKEIFVLINLNFDKTIKMYHKMIKDDEDNKNDQDNEDDENSEDDKDDEDSKDSEDDQDSKDSKNNEDDKDSEDDENSENDKDSKNDKDVNNENDMDSKDNNYKKIDNESYTKYHICHKCCYMTNNKKDIKKHVNRKKSCENILNLQFDEETLNKMSLNKKYEINIKINSTNIKFDQRIKLAKIEIPESYKFYNLDHLDNIKVYLWNQKKNSIKKKKDEFYHKYYDENKNKFVCDKCLAEYTSKQNLQLHLTNVLLCNEYKSWLEYKK